MGLAKDAMRGALVVIAIAGFGSLYQTLPSFSSWVNSFFGGTPNFYQWAIIYSLLSLGSYIAASIIGYSLSNEENEE